MTQRSKRFICAVAAFLATAGAGGAGAAVSMASSCPDQNFTQRFLAWGDRSEYVLAPGGDFTTGGTGWTFTGGAEVVADSSSPSGYAAYVPSGGSITTPPVCVSTGYPSARMFGFTPVSGWGARGNASLLATIVYDSGKNKSVGSVSQQAMWSPTRRLSVVDGRLPVVGASAWIRYCFAATSGSVWELDDIYVDPRMSK